MRYLDMFRFNAREGSRRPFLIDGELQYTYADADDLARRIAGALRRTEISPGDRVAILGENSADFVLFYLACGLVGCVPVPLNYRLAPSEWQYILNHSGAQLILADERFASSIEQLRHSLSRVKIFLCRGASPTADWVSFTDWYATMPAETRAVEPMDGRQPMYQVYTSGTTGRPKGVVMSHDAMAWHVMQQAASLERLGVLDGRLLAAAPMFHAGIAALWMTAAAWGGSIFVQARFVPSDAVKALREDAISWTLLIPSMIQACLVDVPDVADRPYPELHLIVYGGAPIAEPTLRRAMGIFDCDFMQLYGLTETNATISLQPDDHARALHDHPKLLLAAGRPLAGCAVRIANESGADAAPGEVGEVLLRGPQFMTEYWSDPEATASSLRDGWFWTGDAGYLDEDGYLYVFDRIKDMIITGGENVYPSEVEGVLFEHPAVADVAVIGVPDDRWGEAIKAVVVLREGLSADDKELIEFCRTRLARFKCPKTVEFVLELPRNPSGKLLKRELRDGYWRGASRRV